MEHIFLIVVFLEYYVPPLQVESRKIYVYRRDMMFSHKVY